MMDTTTTSTTDTPLRDSEIMMRALDLAHLFRVSCGLSRSETEYLVKRWRDLRGYPIADDRLSLLIQIMYLEPKAGPLTHKEAARVVAATVVEFRDRPEEGAETLRAWCARRGNVTPTQCARLVAEFRERARAA